MNTNVFQIVLYSAVFWLSLSFQAHSKEVIYVGGYLFPPYVEENKGEIKGAAIELIDELNTLQSEYDFQFRITSPKRRYIDFEAGRFDLIFFESIHWGWQNYPVVASNVYMKGGEVYIAFNRPGRDQSFFNDLGNKKIAGFLGYHYGFAGFNADEAFLSKHFNILLSNDHHRNIQLILLDRPELAEVAIVTESFLARYTGRYASAKNKLLISDKRDQEYQHTVLLRKDHSILTIEKINTLLDELENKGILEKFRKRYSFSKN